ncbi:MAG: RidA family protein [Alphaproteobacteria bacterium]|nr:RidA family protein [Alphaproteobacteria bacterium]
MSIENRLAALGIVLPPAHQFPNANRIGCVRTGSLLFVSGHPPAALPGIATRGKVRGDVPEDKAVEAARACALNILATVRATLGTLDAVRRVVKVFGMVNSSPGFERQFAVIDGASDLFLALWGAEHGRHARSAVGMAELPRGIPVEIEAVMELHT